MENEQQIFWSENYALDYIKKNSTFDRKLGISAWQKMLEKPGTIGSILELGCNVGRNIDFLNEVLPEAKKSIVEISKPAFDYVKSEYELHNAFNGSIENAVFDETFDLVFTSGVLIHINPDNLLQVMGSMYDFSQKYILIAEYFNRTPVMIEYQNQKDKLFKRDFGRLFVENFPVKLVDYGFLWGFVYDEAGFDDITWWLFEK